MENKQKKHIANNSAYLLIENPIYDVELIKQKFLTKY